MLKFFIGRKIERTTWVALFFVDCNMETLAYELGSMVGLLFNLLMQVLILRWFAVKFVYDGRKDKISGGHYVMFFIIAIFIYVFLYSLINY